MNCNTTHYRANSSSVPGDPTRISPLHFFEHGGGLYLFAHMPDYGDIRKYAVERFRSVEQTDEHFNYPEGFSPEAELEGSFTLYNGPTTTYRIRFSPRQAKYIEERTWAKNQTIEKEPDGSIILTMTTAGKRDVIRWVLGYGAEAELIEPFTLRGTIHDMLILAADAYRISDR